MFPLGGFLSEATPRYEHFTVRAHDASWQPRKIVLVGQQPGFGAKKTKYVKKDLIYLPV